MNFDTALLHTILGYVILLSAENAPDKNKKWYYIAAFCNILNAGLDVFKEVGIV